MNIAPVILFVYKRLSHTMKTIEALKQNKLAKESELIIFSDGAKNDYDMVLVKEVREYIKNISGFKNVIIIEREKNFGLARNIIDGVTQVIEKYGKVIVLEDDCIPSNAFLSFMNKALNYFENDKRIWHISGWNYPIDLRKYGDVFVWRVMNCWGWATWSDRWEHFDNDPDNFIKHFSKKEIEKFNLDNTYNFWEQILENKLELNNTWAIFWYATIFKNNGLCLNPTLSYIENIGFDEFGTHTGSEGKNFFTNKKLNLNGNPEFDNIKLEEDENIINKIKEYFAKIPKPNKNFTNIFLEVMRIKKYYKNLSIKKPLKEKTDILIVNTYDNLGGAAIAANRLYRALRKKGINCKMLVLKKFSRDKNIIGASNKLEEKVFNIKTVIDQLPLSKYKYRENTIFSPSVAPSYEIVEKINYYNPKIVHLHWICDGFLNISDLQEIKSPIVWTLHDMWAFTGGCHYNDECNKFKNECYKCKILNSKFYKDLSNNLFIRKRNIFSNIESLTIIALSNWLKNSAQESLLFKNKKIFNLPNLIDTTFFKPLPKDKMRKLWNLSENKKLILFGAMNPLEKRKGFIQLKKAIEFLNDENIELVIFGRSTSKNFKFKSFKINFVGEVFESISMVTLYNACDVTIVPSLQENLSNTIMESLSCGIPVVAFNIGGNKDMIEHKHNGYLATPFDSEDLANGINYILNHQNYKQIQENARNKILKEFDENIVVEEYIDLYESILGEAIYDRS